MHINGKTIDRCVVEIDNGHVVNYYTFDEELPLTEWLGGTINLLRDDTGVLVAEWHGHLIE